MHEVTVIVPDDNLVVTTFVQRERAGVGVLNASLRDFGDGRHVFRWHLSIMIELAACTDDGMPTLAEEGVVYGFSEHLRALLQADTSRQNAVFLGRLTWNGTQELLLRAYDPEQAHAALTELVDTEDALRPFDWRLDDDPDWELASWHFNAMSKT